MRGHGLVGTLGVSVSLVVLGFACGEDKKAGCVSGSETCACYPNDTCDGELVCLSHLCVMASAEGGRSGASSGGRGGASSNPGDAGADGEGGVPGSSAGSAGMEGGSTGVEPASGGRVGSGGTAPGGGSTGTTGGTSTTSGGTNADAGEPGEGGAGTGGSTGVPDGSLIGNGDFSEGSVGWNLMLTGGVGVSTFTNGHACVQGDPSGVFSLGWPLDTAKAFVIEPGVPYTLAFRAMAGSPFTLVAKLGHAVTPYTAVFQALPALTTSWASYSYNVVAASGDSAAGFVFSGTLLSGNSVCVDDVSLVKN